MKKIKLSISSIVVFAILGTLLAFKAKPLGQGTVYCTSTCSTNSRIDFRVATSTTTITDPCGNGSGKEYIRFWSDCTPACLELTCAFFEAVSN